MDVPFLTMVSRGAVIFLCIPAAKPGEAGQGVPRPMSPSSTWRWRQEFGVEKLPRKLQKWGLFPEFTSMHSQAPWMLLLGWRTGEWWPGALVLIPAAEVPGRCLCTAGLIRVCHWEIGFLEGLSRMPLLSCFMVRNLSVLSPLL